MEEPKQPQDKFLEKVELLRLCLGMDALQAAKYSAESDDQKFIEIINGVTERMLGVGMQRVSTFPENFYGKYFTIRQGKISAGSAWDMVQIDILECLRSEGGDQVRQFLTYLLDQPDYQADFTAFKAKFARFRNALDKLQGYGLVKKEVVKDTTRYSLYRELVPLIRQVLSSKEVAELTVVSTEAAQKELAEVARMEETFKCALEKVLQSVEETLEFGKTLSIGQIVSYFREMFGKELYFDAVLALAQQYGMTDTQVVNPEGGPALKTGFHLALFGAPGTGKTFAVKDLMMGVPEKGVKAHGIPGINRYCGGVTPALFIRIGEAYQNKRFNFVVTEFNDWFKYKGMVEPLKIALEQGSIRYETKTESVGPYKFSSFFTTNYNTRIGGPVDYQVTISDPNFNAIEDRMLVRLHRMTKERFKELTKSQRELAMGKMKMSRAEDISRHVTLVYAIQIEHELVKGKFNRKKIVIRENAYKKLEEATNLILEQVKEPLRFSGRVHTNALKLAAALSLPSFFAQDGDTLEITEDAFNLALKFFVEEISVRQKMQVDLQSVFSRLGLSDSLSSKTL